jgi:hypothetical protein
LFASRCASPEFDENDPTASPPVLNVGDGILIAVVTTLILA